MYEGQLRRAQFAALTLYPSPQPARAPTSMPTGVPTLMPTAAPTWCEQESSAAFEAGREAGLVEFDATARLQAARLVELNRQVEEAGMAWTVYFTDGVKTESYVWFIEQDDTTAAKVLVDTTGFATGIAVAENGTTIYFGDEQGSLWSVTPSRIRADGRRTAGGTGGDRTTWRNDERLYFADKLKGGGGGGWFGRSRGGRRRERPTPREFVFDVALRLGRASSSCRGRARARSTSTWRTGRGPRRVAEDLESVPAMGVAFGRALAGRPTSSSSACRR